MLFDVEIRGVRPIIHDSGAWLDPKHPANIEKSDITRNRGSNRTESDESRIAELECQLALWLDENGQPTIPAAALRSCIETASRKLKQGPQVREGLIVSEVQDFFYDRERYAIPGRTGDFHTVQGGGGRAATAHPTGAGEVRPTQLLPFRPSSPPLLY